MTGLRVSALITLAKNLTPEIAERVGVLSLAELAGAEDEVRLAALHDRDHRGQVGRVPLAVAVEGGDVLRAALAGDPVAEPERDAVAAVGRQRADQRAVPLGDLRRGVGTAVVDHEQRHRHVGDLLRNFVQDGADVVGLVVSGDDDDQRLKLEVRVCAWRRPAVPQS